MGFLQNPITHATASTQVDPIQISRLPLSNVGTVPCLPNILDNHLGPTPVYQKRRRRRQIPLRMNKTDRGDDTSDAITSLVEKVVDTTQISTPFISPSLSVSYPVALAAGFLTLPLPTASLLLIFFVVYSYAGRQLVLKDYLEEQESGMAEDAEEEEEFGPNTDLVAFGFAVICAALFAPGTTMTSPMDINSPAMALALVAIVFVPLLIGESGRTSNSDASSTEEDFMSLWDRQLEAQDKKNNRRK